MAELDSGGTGGGGGNDSGDEQDDDEPETLEDLVNESPDDSTTTTSEPTTETTSADTGGLTSRNGGSGSDGGDTTSETSADSDTATEEDEPDVTDQQPADGELEPPEAEPEQPSQTQERQVDTGGLEEPDSAAMPDEQAQENIEDAGAQEPDAGVSQVERAEEVGDEATTEADRELQRAEQKERVRAQVVDELEDRGIDPDDVDIDIERSGDEFEVSTTADTDEEFGDIPVRVPGASDEQGVVDEAAEGAASTVVPGGEGTTRAARALATATGLEGTRVESGLQTASDFIQTKINDNRDAGGEFVEDATAASVLTTPNTEAASDLADAGIAVTDAQVEGSPVATGVDAYTEGAFVGSASLADAPGAVLGAKEASEFVAFGAQETAEGRGGEFLQQTEEEAVETGARALTAAQENPVRTAGQLGGALATSTVSIGTAGALSSRAGTATRFAIQPGEELLSGGARSVGSSAIRTGSRARIAVPDGGSRGLDVGRSAVARAKTRAASSKFVQDTRAQGGFGSQTMQKTIQKEQEGSVESEATGIERLQEADFATVRNVETDEGQQNLSPVEAEARERLPPESEFPTRAEFDRELTQRMRQVEQEQMETDLETTQQQSAATEGEQPAGQLEASAFRDTTEVGLVGAAAVSPFAEPVADAGLTQSDATDALGTVGTVQEQEPTTAVQQQETVAQEVTTETENTQEPDTVTDVEQTRDVSQEVEVSQGTELGLGLSTEMDADLASEQMLEQDSRQGQEARFEQEYETAVESEADLFDTDDTDDDEKLVGEFTERQFTVDLPDADDLVF